MILSTSLPESILLTFRRPGDFVIVVESARRSKRALYTTKDVG
jgi:hypothetical protein